MKLQFAMMAVGAMLLAGCSSSSKSTEGAQEGKNAVTAPPEYKVKFETSKGDFTIEVHRDWAPKGADRFYALVQDKFFDGARFFRVVKNFVVQFGLIQTPAGQAPWWQQNLPDDPVKESNTPGTITYAMAGPNTRTTQVFINLADNSALLDKQGFAPFGKVIDGMSVVEQLYSGYGDGPPQGNGPDQSMIEQQGNEYLKARFDLLDYIKSARILQ